MSRHRLQRRRPTAAHPLPKRFGNLRALARFVRPHKRILLAGMVLGLGSAAITLMLPMVTEDLLTGLNAGGPATSTAVLMFTLLLVGAACGVSQGILLGRLGERVVLAARVGVVRRLFRVRTTVLATRSGGELAARVASDTTLLREATTSSLIEIVRAAVTLVGSLVLMFVLDPQLTIASTGALAAVLIGVAVVMPRLAKATKKTQEEVARLGGALDDALRAIRTVKSSTAENRESKRVLSHAREAKREGYRAVRISALVGAIASVGSQLAILIILGYGAFRVSSGALTIPTLIAFLLYSFQLSSPITILTSTVAQLQSGLAAAARIEDIHCLAIERDPAHPITPPRRRMRTTFDFHQVVAGYSDEAPPVLRGIRLAIPMTGHTAIVGPSGAGKTTLFALMLRFIDPSHGQVVLDGVPLPRWRLADLRRRVVYVEQDAPLVPGTLRDNLAYVHPEATDAEIWAALRAVRLDERIKAMPDGLSNTPSTGTMSGGERQRIALARALVARPSILLLDEPTAQLDGITEAVVQECITAISRRGAVISIAHRLSTVIDADQIVVMEAGRVRAVGRHLQLMAFDDLYRTLVAALRIGIPPTDEPVTQQIPAVRPEPLTQPIPSPIPRVRHPEVTTAPSGANKEYDPSVIKRAPTAWFDNRR